MKFAPLGLCIALLAVSAARATVTETTTYKPFLVHGRNATSIYKSLISRSRKKGGIHTYASTEISLRPKLRLRSTPLCQLTDVGAEAKFVIHLPVLADEKALPEPLRMDWQDFVAHLKTHEEHHRAIWLGCARDTETTLNSQPSAPCKSFASSIKSRLQDVNRRCRKANDAFDAAEQGRVLGFAFIRRVVAGQ